jgi:hypothetical protein
MAKSEHVNRAVELLHASEQELVAELESVRAALGALGASHVIDPTIRESEADKLPTPRATSLKSRIRALMDEERGPWNATTATHYLEQTAPVDAKDPKAAARTAFLELVKEGKARRVGHGTYESTKWPEHAVASVTDLRRPANHVGGVGQEVGTGY